MHPVVVAAVTAAVAYEAIRSGSWPAQALGGLILLVGLGTIYSDLQLRFNPPSALDRASAPGTIRVTFGERILPWVFGASTAIIILAAAIYAARELGWW
jgi:hypothetical protein